MHKAKSGDENEGNSPDNHEHRETKGTSPIGFSKFPSLHIPFEAGLEPVASMSRTSLGHVREDEQFCFKHASYSFLGLGGRW